ncbi:MAG: urea ABC transporter permease subunit UrtC [Sphingomonadales bacterium]
MFKALLFPGIILLLAAFAPGFLASYDLNLLARFLSFGLLAMGVVVIWGHCGILSLGQGVFFGLGGYVMAMHMKLASLPDGQIPDFMMWSGRETLPWWWAPFESGAVAILALVALPAIVAALFAFAVFYRRVGGVYFALITQALALAFATLLISRQDSTGGFNGLTNFSTLLGLNLNGPGMAEGLYWVTLVVVALAWLGLGALLKSRFGILLRATRDGENRVRFLGYNPVPLKVAAYAIAAALAGLSGALFTIHAGNISPAMVGVVPSIEMVIWVAVGGRFSLSGALAGALIINFARDRISSAVPELWLYLVGALFILVVTLLPRGLAGLVPQQKASS